MTRRIYIYISRSCHRDRLLTTSCRKDKKKGEDNGPGRIAYVPFTFAGKSLRPEQNASDSNIIRVT